MKIGIDLDNCLNDELYTVLNAYCDKYNDTLTIEDIHCWDISKYVKCGRDIFNLMNDNSLISSFKPLPHAIEVTERLAQTHELYIVSATKRYEVKMKWIKKYFPHIKTDNIIFCKDKSLLSGLDMLIDDGLHNVTGFGKSTIVFDQPWNRNAPDFYPRAKNWLEIEQMLSGYDF